MSVTTTIHLRSETKKLERRTPLSPEVVRALVDAGYKINVEKSDLRIFKNEEYEAAGAYLVPPNTWRDAPADHIIAGLKELPLSDEPLRHTHIQFGHCYKYQEGWAQYLSRFARGHGLLYDIEFLTGEDGRRVAAFGYYAGYAGAAVALLAWAHQMNNSDEPLGSIPLYDVVTVLETDVMQKLATSIHLNSGQPPRVIVVGALGRCGNGAVDFCLNAGVPASSIIKWDMAETAKGGPFPEIAAADILINCVYLGPHKIPPFVTYESLSQPGRKLRVVCDVSCDPTDPSNPIPIYTEISTFLKPTVPVVLTGDGPPLTVVSIDHLPSLVAREASSKLLLPSLMTLNKRHDEGVWSRAQKVYEDNLQKLS